MYVSWRCRRHCLPSGQNREPWLLQPVRSVGTCRHPSAGDSRPLRRLWRSRHRRYAAPRADGRGATIIAWTDVGRSVPAAIGRRLVPGRVTCTVLVNSEWGGRRSVPAYRAPWRPTRRARSRGQARCSTAASRCPSPPRRRSPTAAAPAAPPSGSSCSPSRSVHATAPATTTHREPSAPGCSADSGITLVRRALQRQPMMPSVGESRPPRRSNDGQTILIAARIEPDLYPELVFSGGRNWDRTSDPSLVRPVTATPPPALTLVSAGQRQQHRAQPSSTKPPRAERAPICAPIRDQRRLPWRPAARRRWSGGRVVTRTRGADRR